MYLLPPLSLQCCGSLWGWNWAPQCGGSHTRRAVGFWRSALCWRGECGGLLSLVCHPMPLFPCVWMDCAVCSQCAVFLPCLNAHCCLSEGTGEMIKEHVANGVQGKEAKNMKIDSYQLQRHLRCQYLGLAMPLKLCKLVRRAHSLW